MGTSRTRVRPWYLLFLCLGVMTSASAEEAAPTYMEGSLHKLGRGLANIATCPGELIRVPTIVGRRDGYLAGSSVGVLQGAWRTILRGGAGVIEVLTFYLERPDDFKPLILPEYVFAQGAWVGEESLGHAP